MRNRLVNFRYDPKRDLAGESCGYLLAYGLATYTYDDSNRLKTVAKGTDSYSYQYNGLNNRVAQTINGATTRYTDDQAVGLLRGDCRMEGARAAVTGHQGSEQTRRGYPIPRIADHQISGDTRKASSTQSARVYGRTFTRVDDPFPTRIIFGLILNLMDVYIDIIVLQRMVGS
jgi:YD repeat-containing protein